MHYLQMSRTFPFIQRRGLNLYFRIAVPRDLRALMGLREVTKALRTNDVRSAAPLALLYAAQAKQAYSAAREASADMDKEKLEALMKAQKKIMFARARQEEAEDDVTELRIAHQIELRKIRLEAENTALKLALEISRPQNGDQSAAGAAGTPVSPPIVPTPFFSTVVSSFLDSPHHKKSPAMFKKHKAVLPLMLVVIGEKQINELRQADLNRFFTIIQKLPPHWSALCRHRKITAVKLAEDIHPLVMAPKTFEDTYMASVRLFLKDAKVQWQDEGFPVTLTTDGIVYLGDRKEGENKQRAFSDSELGRLFNGPEMASFKATPSLVHQFWLPQLGLHTGARVNELCQLNPQTDFLLEPETGIWYLKIDESAGADERIDKSVKNTTSFRMIPIHSRLIRLGLLDYAGEMKKNGSKLIFPLWKPGSRRASPKAEKWFRGLLREVGLRDETVGARLVGMHAFRSTILAKAFNSVPRLDVTPITGHAGPDRPVVRSYQGALTLSNKKAILEAIQFGVRD
ncbi:MAG: DUF6538 domain-containing protein [Ramlibacter sp.]